MPRTQLGLSDVPVVRLAHLTDTQRRALTIADNRIAENAGWNEELLRLELGELKLADFDLGLIGFDADALDALFADPDADNEGLTDDDAVPETQERVISQPGDVWVLGEHKVLCGDATVAADYERLLGTELADMAFLDPPYNVNYANSAKDKLRGKNRPILNDNLGDDFEAFLQTACTHLLAVTKGAVYIAMSSSELATLQAAFRAAGGQLVDLHHLGEEHLHAGPRRLPAPVRADPLRLARGQRALLVRRTRPGRCVVREQAGP